MRIARTMAAAAVLALGMPAAAQDGPPPVVAAEAPTEPKAIPLYGDATPGNAATENWGRIGGASYFVRNVTRPTLTPVLPDPAKATGAAVVVAPGGAFMGLAISHEGWRVAQALADRGIAAFVLKYRLLPTPGDEAEAGRFIAQRLAAADGGNADGPPRIGNPQTTQDGLAALAMVRARAAEWGVDPKRVGMIGFSAGAMTALNTALAAGADGNSSEGPAFIGYIYGPQDAPAVPTDAPPLFDAIAFDDPLFPTKGFPVAAAWRKAGRPVELHAYQRGSHGFGLGLSGTTTTGLLDQFTAWLTMQGFLTPAGSR
ncbi:alpha/beta hydrolase [Sphingomonas sp. MG17]|uniref:Alpha/beta hydrolase n=1 Tax=Sphingomonas tagetis TaxID=2949092 RepID=A0A9X2HHV3_9SPHN|nr:alpha/beta hydrolase [Sphingomonas tagetis]MCP3729892.1 alpha/beta hydrolase [Sphingomonas tagetis]